ncbi:MAG: hypothetical protein HOV81_36640 [Kofleriaceae bacterium]|nr:hypothetical protein [Kofleriaceae bacterium]
MNHSFFMQTAAGGVPAVGDVPRVLGRGLTFFIDGIRLAELLGIESEAARFAIQRDWETEPLDPPACLTLAAFANELVPGLAAAVDMGGRPVGEAGQYLIKFDDDIIFEPDAPLAVNSVFRTMVHWIRDGLPLYARVLRFAAAHDLRFGVDNLWAPYWVYDPMPGASLAVSDDADVVFPDAMRILRGTATLAGVLGIDASEPRAILARDPITPDDATNLASLVRRIQSEAAPLVVDNGLPTAEGQHLVGRPEIEIGEDDDELDVKLDNGAVSVLWIAEAGEALARFLDDAARQRKALVHATSDRWWFELTDAARQPIRARSPRD